MKPPVFNFVVEDVPTQLTKSVIEKEVAVVLKEVFRVARRIQSGQIGRHPEVGSADRGNGQASCFVGRMDQDRAVAVS